MVLYAVMSTGKADGERIAADFHSQIPLVSNEERHREVFIKMMDVLHDRGEHKHRLLQLVKFSPDGAEILHQVLAAPKP